MARADPDDALDPTEPADSDPLAAAQARPSTERREAVNTTANLSAVLDLVRPLLEALDVDPDDVLSFTMFPATIVIYWSDPTRDALTVRLVK